MLLNYGHTVGHALEKLSNYELPHGEAVSIGMVAENRLAVGKNLLKGIDADRIENLLKRLHLPVKIPSQYSDQELKRAMDMDKKILEVNFVLRCQFASAKREFSNYDRNKSSGLKKHNKSRSHRRQPRFRQKCFNKCSGK